MEPIVFATWGLVVATGVLAVVSFLQYLTVKRQATDERLAAAGRKEREQAQLAALSEQAEALKASAEAQQTAAAETIEARKAANPLRIDVERRRSEPGYFEATVSGFHGTAAILQRVSFHVGQGVNVPDEPSVPPLVFGNAYLTGEGGQFIRAQFLASLETASGDLLVVRITGRPANGLEQTLEYLYRITGDRTLEDLATTPTPQVF